METIKIQAEIDENHLLQVKIPGHIRTGRHEMVLIINNDKPAKPKADLMKYSGKITSWPDDAVAYQQQLRNEWD